MLLGLQCSVPCNRFVLKATLRSYDINMVVKKDLLYHLVSELIENNIDMKNFIETFIKCPSRKNKSVEYRLRGINGNFLL